MILHVAACLWDVNKHSQSFSRCYDESWVEKLYRGFKRNLTIPFRFVLFTDRIRKFKEPIAQELLAAKVPDYGCLIEPFKLNEPTIICGLDTCVVKNIDHMARYCFEGTKVALQRHPSIPALTINPVVFVPKGNRSFFDDWRGENDMEWLRTRRDMVLTDDLWPGQILSLKLHDVRRKGLQDARICYFHGSAKPHELRQKIAWIREHWQ